MKNSKFPAKFYVSITGLRPKNILTTLWFWRHAIPSKIQSDSAPGILFSEVRKINGIQHTLTAWESKEHMKAYIISGAHLKAMKVFRKIAVGKTFGYESDRIPSWDEVHELWKKKWERILMGQEIKKRIFLIDGGGALLSAVTIGGVLPLLEIGIPQPTLQGLALVALVFSGYSITCYLLKVKKSYWLKIIACANICYSILTLFLLIQLKTDISHLGVIYFVTEILMILFLAGFELRIAKKEFECPT